MPGGQTQASIKRSKGQNLRQCVEQMVWRLQKESRNNNRLTSGWGSRIVDFLGLMHSNLPNQNEWFVGRMSGSRITS